MFCGIDLVNTSYFIQNGEVTACVKRPGRGALTHAVLNRTGDLYDALHRKVVAEGERTDRKAA